MTTWRFVEGPDCPCWASETDVVVLGPDGVVSIGRNSNPDENDPVPLPREWANVPIPVLQQVLARAGYSVTQMEASK